MSGWEWLTTAAHNQKWLIKKQILTVQIIGPRSNGLGFMAVKRLKRKKCANIKVQIIFFLNKFNSEFLDPLSSFSVGYKSESDDANDSKKEDLSQLFCI